MSITQRPGRAGARPGMLLASLREGAAGALFCVCLVFVRFFLSRHLSPDAIQFPFFSENRTPNKPGDPLPPASNPNLNRFPGIPPVGHSKVSTSQVWSGLV